MSGYGFGVLGAIGGVPSGELTVLSGPCGAVKSELLRELVIHALGTGLVGVDYLPLRDREKVAREKLLATRMALAGEAETEARASFEGPDLCVFTADGITFECVWNHLLDRLEHYHDRGGDALVVIDDLELAAHEDDDTKLAMLLSLAHDGDEDRDEATVTVVVATSADAEGIGPAPTKVVRCTPAPASGVLSSLEVVRDEGVGATSLGLHCEVDPLGHALPVPFPAVHLDDGLRSVPARDALGDVAARTLDVALARPVRSAALPSMLGFEPREGSVTVVAARGAAGFSLLFAGRLALEAVDDVPTAIASTRGRPAAAAALAWAATGVAPRNLGPALLADPLLAGSIGRTGAAAAGIDPSRDVAKQVADAASGVRLLVVEAELSEVPRDAQSLANPCAATVVVIPCFGDGHEASIMDRAVMATGFVTVWDTEWVS